MINFIGGKKKEQESKSKKKTNFYINYELSFFRLTNEFLRKKSFKKEKKNNSVKICSNWFYVANELEIIYFPIGILLFIVDAHHLSFIITSIIYFISGLFQFFCIIQFWNFRSIFLSSIFFSSMINMHNCIYILMKCNIQIFKNTFSVKTEYLRFTILTYLIKKNKF